MSFKNFYSRLGSYLSLQKSNFRVRRSIKKGETALSYAPSSLNLLMIDKCNAGCIMCGHDYKSCGSADALSLEKIKSIYSHLDLKQLVEVIYGGGGEPFLNPDLVDIARYTRECCPMVQHTVISNMIAPCESSRLQRLLDARVHFLISVNAASRDTFKTVGGVDAFDTVTANIKKLVELRKKSKINVGISISLILMKQNVDELSRFVQLAKELGVDGVKIVYVRIYPDQYRRKGDGSVQIAPEDSMYFEQDKNDRAIEAAKRMAEEVGVVFEHQPLFKCSRKSTRYCTEPWRSLYIGFNGELYPCAASEIMFMHKVESGQYSSGNILQSHYKEIWNNPFWQALRKTNALQDKKEIIPECLCCGSSIDWNGVAEESSHIMNWDQAERSDLTI